MTTASGEPVPFESEIDFCPTKEQSDLHWETYGFDYKPTVPCGDAREVASQAHDHARLGSASLSTYAEAQAFYDPDDEPNILLDRDTKTGEIAVVYIHPVDPIPAHVKTVEQFQKWAGTFRGED